jgi:hypothetical protein
MALTDSNTYIEPTAGTSLNGARTQFNATLRSILTNFKSAATPTTVNLTSAGDAIGEQDGMLYYRTDTNIKALYISDSVNKKSSLVGGNFTRAGIALRTEDGYTAMASKAATYEIGELAATVTATAGATMASNARLYLNVANAGNDTDFIDVGIPPTNGSVTNLMVAAGGITSDRTNFSTQPLNTNFVNIIPTTEYGPTSGAKWFPETTGVKNAQLKISGLNADANAAIVFAHTNNTFNVSVAHTPGREGISSGITVVGSNGTYVPVTSNLALQSAIMGGTTTPVPVMPAGTIIMYGAAAVPAGYLHCNGSTVSRTTYAALFAVLGTGYGAGDGSSTFTLPNFTDKTVIGQSSTHAISAGAGSFAAGGTLTTASGGSTLSTSTGSASSGVKDAGGISLISAVSIGTHTHTAVVPHGVARFIIKT